ncbi:MAG: CoA protein activase [Peptococcaceae bacterium]|nr:CoA protein activase [Peptococcaceae bacterium]
MRVTFPHMGTCSIALQALLENLGLDVVPPPPITGKTLAIGAQYSPECVCLPFKVNIGNYIEAAENGADTVIMAGGIGPCRFGYYAELQREILQDLGLNVNMLVLEPPLGMITEIWHKLSPLANGNSFAKVAEIFYFAWRLGKSLDHVEQTLNRLRAVEMLPGACDRIWNDTLRTVGKTRTFRELRESAQHIDWMIKTLPIRQQKPLKVGVVGEIYMLLEPKVNLEFEKRLGRMGIEVHRSLYLSDWVCEHLLPEPRAKLHARKVKRAATPYLRGHVGGHGLETIGHSVLYANEGIDGIIQVLPLTCMPEIVAQSILPRISKDFSLPIMTLILDEHSGEAGLQTRLEAFVDMLHTRQAIATGVEHRAK